MTTKLRALALLLFTFAANAFAVGTLIPASNRIDIAHDFQRNIIYISQNDSVLRYDMASGAFLPPYVLGGQLRGMDISPDGNLLAVADHTHSGTALWVYLVDLRTGAVNKVTAPLAFGEGGTFSVAFDANAGLLISSSYEGSGWTPLRRLDLASGSITTLATVTQDTMLASSGDRTRVAFAESNISSGDFGRYTSATGLLERRQSYGAGTSWFNYEIAANRDGSQLIIPTYGGTFVYGDALTKIATLGQYAGPQAIGGAYHPVDGLMYLPWSTTSQVKVLETATFTEVAAYDFEATFGPNGNHAFVEGRTKLSDDGSLLMVTVPGGVRFLRLYVPLSAAPVAASTRTDEAVSVALAGSIGNGGALSYAAETPPLNGAVLISGSNAVYTPNPGFSGNDAFRYRVRYGRAWADADVSVTVAPSNKAPVAYDQTVTATEDTVVALNLQAVDPDGDPLTYSIVSQPAHGVVSGSGSARTYAPAPNFNGPDSFTFQASDSRLSSNTATVTIAVAAVNDPPSALPDTAATKRNSSVKIPVLANDSDVDGDVLAISSVTQPSHGSAVISGNEIIYTPRKQYVGSDSFFYTVTDGKGGVASASVSVVVRK